MFKNILVSAIVGALIGAGVGAIFALATNPKEGSIDILGGKKTFFSKVDTEDGYTVDGSEVINGSGTVTGTVSSASITASSLLYKQKQTAINSKATSVALTAAQSGTTFHLTQATGTALVLPAVASSAGVTYRFVIGAAFSTSNYTVTSAEGDNVEGSLIVAGAVVDCDANDVITFVNDGENIGDFVDLYSDGTYWYIGASGGLTASKLTCSG